MEVVILGQTISVTWFILLFVLMLMVAIFSKSLLCNLGFIICCVLGIYFALRLNDASSLVQYGFVTVFCLFIGFSFQQMLTKVERI